MKIFPCTFLALVVTIDLSWAQTEPDNTALKFVLTPDGVEPTLNATRAQSVTVHCGLPNDWINVTATVWRKDGVEMKPDDEHHIIFHNKNLHFAKLKLADSGRYECELTTDLDGNITKIVRRGYVKVTRNISNAIQTKPVLRMDSEEDVERDCASLEAAGNLSDPKFKYLCFLSDKMTRLIAKPAGTTVTLPCAVRGNPKPSIRWYLNDRPVNIAGNYQMKLLKGVNLRIQDVAPKDAGYYRCEATNGNMTESYVVHFIVVRKSSDKPYIRNLDNSTVFQHGTVRLYCDAVVTVETVVNWNKILGTVKYPVKSRTRNESLLANSHYLILENVTKEDEGEYMCLAGNSIGTSQRTAWVTVLNEFPSPEPSNVQDAPAQANYTQYLFVLAIPMCALVLIFGGLKYRHMQNHVKKHVTYNNYATVKKVLIEKKRFEGNDDEKAVLVPEINIKSVVSMYTDQEYEFPLDVSWEFPRDRLEIGKHLGEGAFGEVKLGIANGIIESGILSKVAVKSLKKTHNDAEMIDLISEMETMKELGKHKNIINLLGCCTQGGELLVIMEFAENGNLRDYLRTNRHHFTYERPRTNIHGGIIPIDVNNPSKQSDVSKQEQLSFADLMSMAYQVARGMDYLVQRKYVHRDLAARNVLVCANKVVKIADFGMTRSTFTNDYYRKKSDGRVPVKWMAPETLFHKIYTTQSDVWSYGILLWEITTLGGTPYPSMPDVTNLLEYLKSGRRMEQPCNCPTELYLIMRDCWMESPTSRPSFSDLVEDIRRILYIASGTDYMDLEGVQPFEYGIIETPPSSPEHSGSGIPFFDPEFVKSFSQS